MQQWCRHTHKQNGIFIPGSGRFGLVMKAQAHGIAPDQPHLNIVAVKTTKRGEGNINEHFLFLRLDFIVGSINKLCVHVCMTILMYYTFICTFLATQTTSTSLLKFGCVLVSLLVFWLCVSILTHLLVVC